MLCEKCKKNNATFYYHENINGTEKSYSLCSECAAELKKNGEIKSFGGFDAETDKTFGFFPQKESFGHLESLFGGLFAPQIRHSRVGQSMAETKKCPLCNMTVSDFVREGMAGCPECYESFSAELEPTIAKLHGRTVHKGKSPAMFKEKNERSEKIKALEEEKKTAIKTENYERAAQIRDELRSLRSKL